MLLKIYVSAAHQAASQALIRTEHGDKSGHVIVGAAQLARLDPLSCSQPRLALSSEPSMEPSSFVTPGASLGLDAYSQSSECLQISSMGQDWPVPRLHH